MLSNNLYMLCVFLLSFSLLCFSTKAQTISYEYGAYTSSCTQICGSVSLLCADSMTESMDCASVAAYHCSSSSLSSNSNVGCTVSGCYVNCQNSYYYSKASAFSNCNTAGTCLTTSSNLNKFCPCYEASDSKLEGWASVGLYLAAAIAVVGVLFFVRGAVNKIRGDGASHEHEALDTSASSNYDIESSGQGGMLSALTGLFGGKKGDASAEMAPKKKVKKTKKTTKFKSKTPLDEEMDETRDMVIK